MTGEWIVLLIAVSSTALLMSTIFMITLRGVGRPMVFMFIHRLLLILSPAAFIIYVSHLPHVGAVLWNVPVLIFVLSYCPFQYAYIFDLLRPGSVRRGFWIASFLPLTVFVTLLIPLITLRGGLPIFTRYAEMSDYTGEPELWLRFAAGLAYMALITVYTVMSVRLLRRHTRNLPDNFSYTQGITLSWVYWVLLIAAIFAAAILLSQSIEGFSGSVVVLFITTVEAFVTTIFVLRQKDLYHEPRDSREPFNDDEIDPSTLSETGQPELTPEKHDKLKRALETLLLENRIYTDPDLNSEKVRSLLHTNRTYLSQIINRDMGVTFFHLINTCRINHAIALMKDPQNRRLKITSIAQRSGFKSQSAFSRFFQKTHGKSPREWREDFFRSAL